MKKEIAAVAATLMLTSGCTSLLGERSREHSLPSVRLGTLPLRLPDAVRKLIANSVSVIADVGKQHTAQGYGDAWGGGSAVHVSGDLYATAGHVFLDSKGRTYKPLDTLTCQNAFVEAPSKHPALVKTNGGSEYLQYGGQYPVQGLVATRPTKVTGGADFSMFRAPDIYGTSQPILPLKIAGQPPKAGDALYTINYEPTAEGKIREPYKSDLLRTDIATHLNTPAIFGMIALGSDPDGRILAVDGQRSYGEIYDERARPGASGGPVYTNNGELMGLIVEEVIDISPPAIGAEAGYKLVGSSSPSLDMVIIQPVTEKMITDYSKGLGSGNRC